MKKRREPGDHHNLIPDMRVVDTARFANHLKVTSEMLDKLLEMVTPLKIKISGVRDPIHQGARLEITLR